MVVSRDLPRPFARPRTRPSSRPMIGDERRRRFPRAAARTVLSSSKRRRRRLRNAIGEKTRRRFTTLLGGKRVVPKRPPKRTPRDRPTGSDDDLPFSSCALLLANSRGRSKIDLRSRAKVCDVLKMKRSNSNDTNFSAFEKEDKQQRESIL